MWAQLGWASPQHTPAWVRARIGYRPGQARPEHLPVHTRARHGPHWARLSQTRMQHSLAHSRLGLEVNLVGELRGSPPHGSLLPLVSLRAGKESWEKEKNRKEEGERKRKERKRKRREKIYPGKLQQLQYAAWILVPIVRDGVWLPCATWQRSP